MPAAIRVNALTPPRAVAVGSTVNLSEAIGGWVSYDWALLDRPENSAAAITGPTTPTPTVVADTEGTYLISLTVDAGLTTVNRTTAIFYVARLLDGRRDPAAGETTEDRQRGFAWQAHLYGLGPSHVQHGEVGTGPVEVDDAGHPPGVFSQVRHVI